jgi:beta-glucosidase
MQRAPGYKDFRSYLKASHHLLLSHGKTVQAFRELAPSDGEIGITLNIEPTYPIDHTEDSIIAARLKDGFQNRWFLDPVLKGEYPQDMMDVYSSFSSFDYIKNGDLQKIAQPIDFLGVNYYSIATNKQGNEGELGFLGIESIKTGKPQTFMEWEIEPKGLYDTLQRIKKDYKEIPIYITENGAAFDDRVELDGTVMDNFEWRYGYSKRFGIVYIDYKTQKRIQKNSALWYKRVIEDHGIRFHRKYPRTSS